MRHFFGRVVVEDECADAVALMENPPCCQRGYLCCDDRLHRDAAAKKHVDPLVDDEHCRAVALLGVDADIRFLRARCDPPVDAAHVVAGNVAAQFFEVEASATHMRCPPSKEQAVDGLVMMQREASWP